MDTAMPDAPGVMIKHDIRYLDRKLQLIGRMITSMRPLVSGLVMELYQLEDEGLDIISELEDHTSHTLQPDGSWRSNADQVDPDIKAILHAYKENAALEVRELSDDDSWIVFGSPRLDAMVREHFHRDQSHFGPLSDEMRWDCQGQVSFRAPSSRDPRWRGPVPIAVSDEVKLLDERDMVRMLELIEAYEAETWTWTKLRVTNLIMTLDR